MYLTPQGLLVKPGKKDRLVFDVAYQASPSSICINNFTSPEDEIELQYGYIFKNDLKRIYNLQITYNSKEILLFYVNVSGAFRYIKLYSDVAGARAFIIRS